ncbi:MAG: amidohydrolase family protein [Christensenellales bacterium]|jgi:predicted TIM-barrel fold metal-dependent hydrolase|nr:MAG: amidohydrolase [Clostridia bacterium]
MVIDVHAHIYPDNIAEKAAMNIGYFYDKHMTNPNGSVKRLLEIGDRAGVDKFVVHSAATTPHQVKSINNFIKASVLAHPDRFVGLCTIHPGMEDPIAELERAESLGLKGIKLHPDFQKFAITDSSMGPIYDFCQATGYPILFHTGDYRYHYSNPCLIPRLLESFPRLRLICAHFGGWTEWKEAEKYIPGTNAMVDCSSCFFTMTDERIMEFMNMYGEDRIMFGSDYPMWDAGTELARLRSLPLSKTALEKIQYKNAAEFLSL